MIPIYAFSSRFIFYSMINKSFHLSPLSYLVFLIVLFTPVFQWRINMVKTQKRQPAFITNTDCLLSLLSIQFGDNSLLFVTTICIQS